MITTDYDAVLLPQYTLEEYNLQPHDATLEKVIKWLNLKPAQRNEKHISILKAISIKISFFQQKIKELGISMIDDACEKMTYEFVEQSQVFIK